MEPAEMVNTVAQEFQNVCVWDGCATENICLVSTCKHVLEVAHECGDAHQKNRQIEQERWQFQQEQHESHGQLVDLLQKFGEEVKRVEKLRTQVHEGWLDTMMKKE